MGKEQEQWELTNCKNWQHFVRLFFELTVHCLGEIG